MSEQYGDYREGGPLHRRILPDDPHDLCKDRVKEVERAYYEMQHDRDEWQERAEAAEAELADLRAKLHAVEEELNAVDQLNGELMQDVRAAEADRDRYREALERIADPRHAKCCPVAVGLAREALDNQCPAGGPHTISPDDTECVECGARRPEPREEDQ